jgi:hypothetical protein
VSPSPTSPALAQLLLLHSGLQPSSFSPHEDEASSSASAPSSGGSNVSLDGGMHGSGSGDFELDDAGMSQLLDSGSFSATFATSALLHQQQQQKRKK